MKNYYKIAGLIVEMDSFGRTVEQAKPYLSEQERTTDIVISSVLDVLKKHHPTISNDDAEYLGTGVSFYRQLLHFNGMMLHSSAVVVDGRAYLFSAHSGTGKSTHTGLWLNLFGERAYILNDDKPALRLKNGEWFAYGTPWSGKNDISVNTGVPVAGIAMVERGESNQIERFTGKEAILSILTQVNRPKDQTFRMKLLDLLDKLMTQVPIWKLKCNMEPEAAIVAYEAMSGEKWRQ